jgi:transposase
MGKPFLHCHHRFKNGKDHCYWGVAEKVRTAAGKWVQRPILYLGEINDSQKAAWTKTIEVFDTATQQSAQLALYPAGQVIPAHVASGVRVRLDQFTLHRPRQWGACWVGCKLWQELKMDEFWGPLLPPSREGTDWKNILQTLTIYRLLDPGSEWRLHRQWFQNSALADLLNEDFALAEKNNLYRCLDKLLGHRSALFKHLRQRWEDLFGVKFNVLLYDLTSTYFESDPPFPEGDPRRFGYSRDKRSDCVQVVVALVVTPEGFPLAYEMLPGNTSDRTTLKAFLEKIEALYGKAERIWIMDRGIPTQANLEEMQAAEPKIYYLVGTPRAQLAKLEVQLTQLPWRTVRSQVEVKLLPQGQELYVLARSQDRRHKERAMRRRKLKDLWKRLKELQQQKRLKRDDLLLKLGRAQEQAGRAYELVEIQLPPPQEAVNAQTFKFSLRKDNLRAVIKQEGRYLLRTNLTSQDPAQLWQYYIQLTEVEAAFKNLKDDLSLRPIFHQKEERIAAHIFVAFLSYCLQVTLRGHLRPLAPGLTSRAVLDKFAAMQMVDVHFPTTDGRELIFRRYTQPEKDQKMILEQLRWELPEQPPPRITAKGEMLKD